MVSASEGSRACLLGPLWAGDAGRGDQALSLRRTRGTWFTRSCHAISCAGICLLAGTGAAILLMLCRDPRHRSRAIWAASFLWLWSVSFPWPPIPFTPTEPSMRSEQESLRGNSGQNLSRDAKPVCLRWDLGIGEWNSTNLNVAVYLCNQMIYSPHRRQPRERCSQPVSPDRPLRCVSPLTDPADNQVWPGSTR